MVIEHDLLLKDLSRQSPGRLNQTQVHYVPGGLPDDIDHSLAEGDTRTAPPTKETPRKGLKR